MTPQVSPQGLDWYRRARFGMFVHWGLYSMIGRGEWEQVIARIPAAEYAPLAKLFNPAAFDAKQLVAHAEAAGQRYLTITSRHHDGFSMYDTALSDFKITRSPFRRDPIAELADACRESGTVKLGFYISLVDWHHPGYLDSSRWEDYLAFLFGQVEELCTQYGEIAQIWFDGDWPNSPYRRNTPAGSPPTSSGTIPGCTTSSTASSRTPYSSTTARTASSPVRMSRATRTISPERTPRASTRAHCSRCRARPA